MSDKTRPNSGCGGPTCKCRPVEPANVIAFEVPGLPVPKARARVTRRGITYTPRETLNYEAQVRVAYANAYPGRQPFAAGTALALQLEAHFPLPAGAPKRLRRQMEAGTTTPMTQRPDLDNLVKTVLDALNRVAWADDGQVAEITARKRRTVSAPRLSVSVAELASTIANPSASTQDGQGEGQNRRLPSASFPRFCARTEGVTVPPRSAQAPRNGTAPHRSTLEGKDGCSGRRNASAFAVFQRSERPKAVAAPAGAVGATDVARPGAALGPSCASSAKDPTGITRPIR